MTSKRSFKLISRLPYSFSVFSYSLIFATIIGSSMLQAAAPIAPMAKRIPKELTIHGDTRVDPYFWMNQRDTPEVIQYLKDENRYAKSVMQHTEKLQETIYQEIIGRIDPSKKTVPYKSNGYYYYRRYLPQKEYPIYCRKKGHLKAPEEILLDVNQLAKNHDFFNVKRIRVSSDNMLMAYSVDIQGNNFFTVYVKDLTSGKLLKDQISQTTGHIEWDKNNKDIYYTLKDHTLRANRLWKHSLGTDTKKDQELYEEKDTTFSIYLSKSKSGRFIFLESESTLSNEIFLIDLESQDKKLQSLQPRQKNMIYYAEHNKNKFYIRTNWNAPNFRMMETPVDNTGRQNWKDLIPHDQDTFIATFELFEDFIVIDQRMKGLTQFKVLNLKSKKSYYMDFAESAYEVYIDRNPEIKTDNFRFSYTSFTTPDTIYDFNMKTQEKTLLKQENVGANFKSSDYVTERIHATSHDGVKIPISLVYKKDLFKKDGSNPLQLYGYGSYGSTRSPEFSIDIISLLDRGFVYAMAHIRGGQLLGRHWYENGKLFKKKNTFKDFISAAEHLVTQKYTHSDKLFAWGRSAGGLLMGAVVNMRPDLFRGVIAGVPFVDVITTMLDDSIPLTTSEYDEWGNPNIKSYYDYILSYSPYDNIMAKNYPAMMITGGYYDSQVQYWEPAKWAAKLRYHKTDDNMLLLITNMKAGHSGDTGRFSYYKLRALQYAFMLNLLK